MFTPATRPVDPAVPAPSLGLPSRRSLLFIGLMGWVTIMALYWPGAFSLEDEVGYVGEARLLLQGRVSPRLDDPGVWVPAAGRRSSHYPLFGSLLMAPLLALTPTAVFALGIAAAVGLCLTAARILRSHGTDPTWALIFLAHPTIVILSRTATVDIPICLLMLWTWVGLREDRRSLTAMCMLGMVLIKPVGIILGGFLVAGRGLTLLPGLRTRDRQAWTQLLVATAILIAAGGMVAISNLISVGRIGFSYDYSKLNVPAFGWAYLASSGAAHARSVLVLPPLLLAGIVPFLKRREHGPILVVAGFGAMMCLYFFVDSGTTPLESLVLAPRLILPVMTFLLIGYAEVLSAFARRLGTPALRLARPLLVLTTLAIVWGVSARHRRWQQPMIDARRATQRLAERLGSNELTLLPQAAKVGMLFRGRVHAPVAGQSMGPIVLCSERPSSYRRSGDARYSCEIPGYRVYERSGDFAVLVAEHLADGLSTSALRTSAH